MNTQDSEYEMLYEALAGEPPRRGRGIPHPWLEAWETIQTVLSPVAHRLQLVLDSDYSHGYVLLYADGVNHRAIRWVPHRETYRLRQSGGDSYQLVTWGYWSEPAESVCLRYAEDSLVKRVATLINRGEVLDYDPLAHRWRNLTGHGKQWVGAGAVWCGGMLGFGGLSISASWLGVVGLVGLFLGSMAGLVGLGVWLYTLLDDLTFSSKAYWDRWWNQVSFQD